MVKAAARLHYFDVSYYTDTTSGQVLARGSCPVKYAFNLRGLKAKSINLVWRVPMHTHQSLGRPWSTLFSRSRHLRNVDLGVDFGVDLGVYTRAQFCSFVYFRRFTTRG